MGWVVDPLTGEELEDYELEYLDELREGIVSGAIPASDFGIGEPIKPPPPPPPLEPDYSSFPRERERPGRPPTNLPRGLGTLPKKFPRIEYLGPNQWRIGDLDATDEDLQDFWNTMGDKEFFPENAELSALGEGREWQRGVWSVGAPLRTALYEQEELKREAGIDLPSRSETPGEPTPELTTTPTTVPPQAQPTPTKEERKRQLEEGKLAEKQQKEAARIAQEDLKVREAESRAELGIEDREKWLDLPLDARVRYGRESLQRGGIDDRLLDLIAASTKTMKNNKVVKHIPLPLVGPELAGGERGIPVPSFIPDFLTKEQEITGVNFDSSGPLGLIPAELRKILGLKGVRITRETDAVDARKQPTLVHEALHELEAKMSPKERAQLYVLMKNNPPSKDWAKWHKPMEAEDILGKGTTGLTAYFDAAARADIEIPDSVREFVNQVIGRINPKATNIGLGARPQERAAPLAPAVGPRTPVQPTDFAAEEAPTEGEPFPEGGAPEAMDKARAAVIENVGGPTVTDNYQVARFLDQATKGFAQADKEDILSHYVDQKNQGQDEMTALTNMLEFRDDVAGNVQPVGVGRLAKNILLGGLDALARGYKAASEFEYIQQRGLYGQPTGERFSSAEVGAAVEEAIPGAPGRVTGAVTESLLNPSTIVGAGLGGTGLVANIVGRGTLSAARFGALTAGAVAASETAEELGAPTGVQIGAGFVGGAAGAGVGAKRVAASIRGVGEATTPARQALAQFAQEELQRLATGEAPLRIPPQTENMGNGFFRRVVDKVAPRQSVDDLKKLIADETGSVMGTKSWLDQINSFEKIKAQVEDFKTRMSPENAPKVTRILRLMDDLPEDAIAPEGIARQVEARGNDLTYRRVRDYDEAEEMLQSLRTAKDVDAQVAAGQLVLEGMEKGNLWGAGFRPASVRDGAYTRKIPIINRAEKAGAVPVFTSPFPTVASMYEGGSNLMVAIEYEPKGRIWRAPRVDRTEGQAYSATFVDAEDVIDARSIRRVWVLNSDQMENMPRFRAIFDQNVSGGAFRGAYKDKDPALVAANIDAARNLERPIVRLQRPLIETPLFLENGLGIRVNQRVRLSNGTVGTVSKTTAEFIERQKPGQRQVKLNNTNGPTPVPPGMDYYPQGYVREDDVVAVYDSTQKAWRTAKDMRSLRVLLSEERGSLSWRPEGEIDPVAAQILGLSPTDAELTRLDAFGERVDEASSGEMRQTIQKALELPANQKALLRPEEVIDDLRALSVGGTYEIGSFRIRRTKDGFESDMPDVLPPFSQDDLKFPTAEFPTAEDAVQYLDRIGEVGQSVDFADINRQIREARPRPPLVGLGGTEKELREDYKRLLGRDPPKDISYGDLQLDVANTMRGWGDSPYSQMSVRDLERVYQYQIRAVAETQASVDALEASLNIEPGYILDSRIVNLESDRQRLIRAASDMRTVAAWLDARSPDKPSILGRIGDALSQMIQDETGAIGRVTPRPKPPTAQEVEAASAPSRDPAVRALWPRDQQKAIFKPDDFQVTVDRIIKRDPDFYARLNGLIQKLPLGYGAMHFMEPIMTAVRRAAKGQVAEGDTIPLVMVERDLYISTMRDAANVARQDWYQRSRRLFDLDPNTWKVRNLSKVKPDPAWMAAELKKGGKITKESFKRLDVIATHRDKYNLDKSQISALDEIEHTHNALLQVELANGVNVFEREGPYWHQVVTESPKGALKAAGGPPAGGVGGMLVSRTPHLKPRRFKDVLEGQAAGSDFANPKISFADRMNEGIEEIGNVNAWNRIKPLGETAAERVPEFQKEALKAARESYRAFRAEWWKKAKVPDSVLELQAKIDRGEPLKFNEKLKKHESDILDEWRGKAEKVMDAEPELLARREELQRVRRVVDAVHRLARQPEVGVERGAVGRIFPQEVVNQLEKYGFDWKSGGIGTPDEFFQMLRASQVTGDVSMWGVQGFISLPFRNPSAFFKGVTLSLASFVHEPMGYISKNLEAIEDGVRYRAVSPPSEYLFRELAGKSFLSKMARGIVMLPGIKQTQRAFEWFALVGQTELWKALNNETLFNEAFNKGGFAGVEAAKREAAAVVRKQLGVILRPGLTETERGRASLLFYAPAFTGAVMSLMTDAVRPGIRGAEARRAVTQSIAGYTALTFAATYGMTGKLPELDPNKRGWLSIPVGDGHVNFFGPYYPYMRAFARMGDAIEDGDLEKAAESATYLLRGKTGLSSGAFIDFMLGEDVMGDKVQFKNGLGLVRYIMKDMGPIGIRQLTQPFMPTSLGGTEGTTEKEFAETGVAAFRAVGALPAGAAAGAALGGRIGGVRGAVVGGVAGGVAGVLAGEKTGLTKGTAAGVLETPAIQIGAEAIERFPARVGELAGIRTSPLSPAALLEQAQTRAVEGLIADGEIPAEIAAQIQGIPHRELGSGERDLVDRRVGQNEPEKQDAYERVRRAEDSIFQSIKDQAIQRRQEDLPRFDGLLDALLAGGDPSKITKEMTRLRAEQRGALANIYEGKGTDAKEYQKQISSFEPTDMRSLENRWYALADSAKTATGLDFDKLETLQMGFLSDLSDANPELAARFLFNLEAQDKYTDSHPLLQMKRGVDEALEPYYNIKEEDSEAKDKWLQQHPDENAGLWLFYDSRLESMKAVQAARAYNIPKREIKLAGTKQLVTDKTAPVYERFTKEIERLHTIPTEAADAVGKVYSPRTELRKSSPLYDALYFWLGYGTPPKLGDDAGTVGVYHLDYVQSFIRSYGARPDKARPRQLR